MMQRILPMVVLLIGVAASQACAAQAAAAFPEVAIIITAATALFYAVGGLGVVYEGAQAAFKISGRLWGDAVVHGIIAVVLATFIFILIPRATLPGAALAATVDTVAVDAVVP